MHVFCIPIFSQTLYVVAFRCALRNFCALYVRVSENIKWGGCVYNRHVHRDNHDYPADFIVPYFQTNPLHVRVFIDMGVSIHGYPQTGWFIRENPNPKWMITRGTPISGNLHIAW